MSRPPEHWRLQRTPLDDGRRTRLIARTRSAPNSGFGAVTEALMAGPAHLIMEVGVLRGVKHRAECLASPAIGSDTALTTVGS